MSFKFRRQAVVLVAVCSAGVVSGCGGDGAVAELESTTSTSTNATAAATAEIPTVELVATEHAFTAPERTVGGVVRLVLDNNGGRVHMAQLVRIDDDHTVSDVVELLRAIEAGNDSGGPPAWLHMTGMHFSPLGPGREVALVSQLDPGRYVVFCQLVAVNGSHAAHGMVAEFEVAGSTDAVMPTPEMTLVVDDDGFTLPDLPPGRQFVGLRNDGELPHQFEFGQLHDGVSVEAAGAFLQGGQVGELPAEWAGGVIGVAPGATVVIEVELDAGEWSVLDVGDTGVMVGSLTVE